jgi:hypothetical protein
MRDNNQNKDTMSKTATVSTPTDRPKRAFVKSMVQKAIATIAAVKEAVANPDKKDPYVNRRPALRPTAAKKSIPKIELLRFRRSNQRKRRKLNRQIHSRGFSYRHA